jgi:hypothetical protein
MEDHQMHRTRSGLTRATLLTGAAFLFAPGFTLVTSDGSGTHIADPLMPVFGIDHVGVGRMFIMFPGSPTPGICTASLLTEGGRRYAITAAHCLSDGSSILADSVTVRFTTPGGPVLATASKALGQIHVHPLFDGDVLHGYDVAILEFTDPVDPVVPSYDLIEPADGPVITLAGIKVGFGTSGSGGTGDTLAAGTKRAGLNTWESAGLGALGVTAPTGFLANDTQLTYDFDGLGGTNNAFAFYFGLPDPGFGPDEVMAGVGDSGGPTFVFTDAGAKIAGVASYRTRVIPSGMGGLIAEVPGAPFPGSPDVNAVIDSSWGEFGADANLQHPDLRSFVLDIIAGDPPCLPDTNGDGILSPADFSSWIAAFNAMAPACDQNGDGLCTPADFSAWIANFNAGCL